MGTAGSISFGDAFMKHRKSHSAPLEKDWECGSLADTCCLSNSSQECFVVILSLMGNTAFTATPHPFLGKSFLSHCSWPGCLHLSASSLRQECTEPQCIGARTLEQAWPVLSACALQAWDLRAGLRPRAQ